MKARGKNKGTPHPIWIQGEYIREPPIRPMDGAKRPIGHYIDKGGYPGANVYEISAETLCMHTGAADRQECGIYEKDIILYETKQEIGYFIIEDAETAVDIMYGEILGLKELQTEDILVIGNVIDFPDFIEGVRYCVDTEGEIPYLPALDVETASYPYMKLTCLKCNYTTLSCAYMARHKGCGGYFKMDFATKVYRKGEQKEKAFA